MRAGKFAKIFVNGGELTTYSSNVEISTTYDEIEKSAYGQNKQYILGQGDSTVTIDGYFTPESVAALTVGAGDVVSVVLGNNADPAVGDVSFSLLAATSEVTATPAKDGVQAITAKLAAQNSGSWGVMLANQAITSASNGSAINQVASSTNGAVGYLHVYGISASDTATVTIQDSIDSTTWVDLITFTVDCSALAAERVAVAGTVRKYVRAKWDVTGTDVSINIAVFFQRL